MSEGASARRTVSSMIALFGGHCNPKVNQIAERHRIFVPVVVILETLKNH